MLTLLTWSLNIPARNEWMLALMFAGVIFGFLVFCGRLDMFFIVLSYITCTLYLYCIYIRIKQAARNDKGPNSQQRCMLGSDSWEKKYMVSIHAWLSLVQAVGTNVTQVVCNTVYMWYGEQARRWSAHALHLTRQKPEICWNTRNRVEHILCYNFS